MGVPRILIIEDDAVIRKSLEFKLGSQGYEVVSAATGSAALKSAMEQKPDLMVLDLKLDSDPLDSMRDGLTLLDWMRRMLPDSDFPVVVYTMDDTPATKARAQASRVFAVVLKSEGPQKLLDTIHNALGGWEQTKATA